MAADNHRAFSCDTCSKPGTCCKGFVLSFTDNTGIHQNLSFWDDVPIKQQLEDMGLPFDGLHKLETYTDPDSGRDYSSWRITCPKVTPQGRCSIYEDRPKLCRDYQAGDDPMCVYHIKHLTALRNE